MLSQGASGRIWERLRRRTTSGRFIPEIDGLRFVAIALVVVFHIAGYVAERAGVAYAPPPDQEWLGQIVRTGNNGVHLFFIISGFILALPFAAHWTRGRPPVSLKAYYLRRVTRLEPPYLLAMIGCYVMIMATGAARGRDLLPHLGASLVYLHNLIYARGSDLNVVAWSLEIEIQFYILAPLLTRVFRLSAVVRRIALVCCIAAAILAQHLWVADSPRLRLTLLGFLQFFLAGFLLADFYLTEWSEPARHPMLWDVASIVGWPLLVETWIAGEPWSLWLFPPFALVLYCAAFRGRWSSRVFSDPWLTTIGGMCYSIYLLHYPLISAIGRRTVHIGASTNYAAHLAVQLLLIVPVVISVSLVYFVLIERPCMDREWPQKAWRWLRALGSAPRARPAGAVPPSREIGSP